MLFTFLMFELFLIYNIISIMKKILSVLFILLFSATQILADELPIREKFEQSKPTYKNKLSIVKFFQNQVNSANDKNLKALLNCYAQNYVNNDGFDIDVSKNIVENLWKEKSDIRYKNTVNTISFYGETAIVNVTETTTAKLNDEKNKKGTLKSCSNVTYYLRRNGEGWLITSENVISEEINMLWGDAKYVAMFMEAPNEVASGAEYSAKLYIAPPTGILAIASISSEKITYPQKQQKDAFRKFAPDYSLERLLIANSENTNEYAISTIMFSPTNSGNNNITGYACLIRRVNVVPKNNYIEVQKKIDDNVKK